MSVNRYECVWKKNGEVYTSDSLFNILTLSYLSLSTSKGFFNLEHLLFITETKNIKRSFFSVCLHSKFQYQILCMKDLIVFILCRLLAFKYCIKCYVLHHHWRRNITDVHCIDKEFQMHIVIAFKI